MKTKILQFVIALLMTTIVMPATVAFAEEIENETDVNIEVTAEDLGESEEVVNEADEEEVEVVSGGGMVIEVGNTTAEQTTIIVRVNIDDSTTEDITLEITADTEIIDKDGASFDLSNIIAGDNISYIADNYTNSGQLVATRIVNNSFEREHRSGPHNGWIKAIRADEGEVDVEWGGDLYTLDVSEARIVAGAINPASISDLAVDDRVRFRGSDDGDDSDLTWDASILVVLRRGSALFMRVTRWAVPGTIVAMPDDLALPATIDVEVRDSKFYEKGDVNNLIGAPGTIIQVDITEDTKLVRHFFGKALLKEFSEGDQVRIIGRTDESTGNLVAKFMKNESIQRLGVATKLGRVTAIDSQSKLLDVELINTSRSDKTYQVQASDETVVTELNEEVDFSTIEVDDVVRVRGTLNRNSRVIVADKIVLVLYRDELQVDVKEKIHELRERVKSRISELKDKRDFINDRIKIHVEKVRSRSGSKDSSSAHIEIESSGEVEIEIES